METFGTTNYLVLGIYLAAMLGIGAFLQNIELPEGIAGEKVMPYYIIHYLPQGISGLLITAVFAAAMSSMDSGTNSIATVIIKDLANFSGSEVRLARILTVVLGVTATSVAFYAATLDSILDAFFGFIGMFSPVLAGHTHAARQL